MYVDLFRQIKVTDLQYDNGTFLETASDVAYMTSAIELVGSRYKFLTELNYEYHFDTGLNDVHFKQVLAENIIFEKRSNNPLQNFSYANFPKTIHFG